MTDKDLTDVSERVETRLHPDGHQETHRLCPDLYNDQLDNQGEEEEDMPPESLQPHQAVNPVLTDQARLETLRNPTPDSEAISSDDEHEANDSPSNTIVEQSRLPPARRSSWLAEVQPGPGKSVPFDFTRRQSVQAGPPRRPSLQSSPSTHNLLDPGEDFVIIERTPSNYSFGTNTSTSPVHSPRQSITIFNPARRSMVTEEISTTPRQVSYRDAAPRTPVSLPIPISENPTPKAFRSQSYSVGQRSAIPANAAHIHNAETQRRPSQLGMPYRPAGKLTDVAEVTNGAFSTEEQAMPGSPSGYDAGPRVPLWHHTQRPYETTPSPLLRQATNSMSRRGAGYNGVPSGSRPPPQASDSMQRFDFGFDGTYEIDGLGADLAGLTTDNFGCDGANDAEDFRLTANSFGFDGANDVEDDRLTTTNFGSDGANDAEDVRETKDDAGIARRSQWQSSLGFGTIPEPPHSRRHSMAEMPTRRGSLAAAAANQDALFSPPPPNMIPLPQTGSMPMPQNSSMPMPQHGSMPMLHNGPMPVRRADSMFTLSIELLHMIQLTH